MTEPRRKAEYMGTPIPAVVTPDERLRDEVRRAFQAGAQAVKTRAASELSKLSLEEIGDLAVRGVLTHVEAHTLIEQHFVSRETSPEPPKPYPVEIPVTNLKVTMPDGTEREITGAHIVFGPPLEELATEAVAQAEAAFADEPKAP